MHSARAWRLLVGIAATTSWPNPSYVIPILGTHLIFMQTSAWGRSPQDGCNQFQGIWNGRIDNKTVQLDIKADGTFHWTATVGGARGIGDSHIWKDGADYLIELQFIQRDPLKIQLTDDAKSLRLSSQTGVELILSSKP
jgi:hypothetical protein